MNADITNALVAQNNDLAARIERAEDAADLERADMMVTFVANLWTALGYDYKIIELRQRIRLRANLLYSAEERYIEGCRKNDSTLGTARTNLSKLATLAAS